MSLLCINIQIIFCEFTDHRRRFVLDSEGPVAFSAVIDPTVIDHTKANSPIKFETILTEYGGGYNNDTGIFVAPNTGLYLLSCSLLDHMSQGGHGGVMIHGEIMRNHDVLARVFAHAEATYRDQGANTIIAKVCNCSKHIEIFYIIMIDFLF